MNDSRPAFSRRDAFMLAGVLLVTALAYLRCLGNGFVFDDKAILLGNGSYFGLGKWPYLWQSMFHDVGWSIDPYHEFRANSYRPLQGAWFFFIYQCFGPNPFGWHATSLALHLAATYLLFKVAGRLTADRYAATLAALLFGLIPAHAEVVVWAAANAHILITALELASLYFFIGRGSSRWRGWAPALLFYAVATLTLETAATFPALIAAYVFFLEPAPSPAEAGLRLRVGRALLCAAPFAAELALYLVARRAVLGLMVGAKIWGIATSGATVGQLLTTIPGMLATYFKLLVIPTLPGPTHRLLVVKSAESPGFFLPLGALSALAATFWMFVRNHPRRRLYLFCAAWMAIAMAAPMLNLTSFLKEDFVHDRYLYLPSVGWCVLIADWAIGLARRGVLARRLVSGATVAVAVLYPLSLWNLQRIWHDDNTFYSYCTDRFPESAGYHTQLALTLKEGGDLVGAERELRKALSLDPSQTDPRRGKTLYALGVVHAALGRTREAAAEIAQGLNRFPSVPPTDAYIMLAELYDSNGDRAQSEAVLEYLQTLPNGAEAAGMARARISIRRGDGASAETTLRDLAQRYPHDQRVWTMLGLVLAGEDRNQEALAAYQHALALAPNDSRPHFYAAQAFHAMGREREALAQCQAALAINPAYADATALMAEIGAARHADR
ncbi:MAG: hypothetical protein WA005_04580 [Candidatus Binataceae bacterium]